MACLLGIDVGYSLKRRSTGIAWSTPIDFGVTAAFATREDRLSRLPPGFRADLVAIDGPLLPVNSEAKTLRVVERLLSSGDFQKRCKPGFSHFGQGLKLREAAAETARQISPSLLGSVVIPHDRAVFPDCAIVEAFPNAFLGVMIDEDAFSQIPPLRRGKKFDWLYSRAIESNRLSALVDLVGIFPSDLHAAISREKDHEHRAAFVCLLTAALAYRGFAEVVGEQGGGWFWLPPIQFWADWAREGLNALR